MGKEAESEDIIDLEELAISTSLELEALIEILVEKKAITKDEVLKKMKSIVKEIE